VKLLSMRVDLLDAFDDQGVDIEVVANIEDVDGEIVVMCAGVSSTLTDRREWGMANRDPYEQIAETCAQRVPDAWFVIVSNPVELAVHIFSEKLGSKRVIGMGAEQDSLRFSRAIARDLRMHRNDVFASVLGEHGQAMIPLWSSVELNTTDERLLERLNDMRIRSWEAPLDQRVAELRGEVLNLLKDRQVNEAYEVTRRALPDARIFVQPFITLCSIHSTPNSTANATLRFLMELLANNERPLHGQVLLSGEFLDIEGVCGVPVHIDQDGWRVRPLKPLTDEEQWKIPSAAGSIERYVEEVRCAEAAMCV